MGQLERPLYDCCNYCKYFQTENENISAGYGVCKNSLLGRGQPSQVFFHSSCIVGCFHTIHNHYNIESPEYIQEYKKALCARYHLRTDIFYYKNNIQDIDNKFKEDLMWDTYREKHRQVLVYMPENILTELKK